MQQRRRRKQGQGEAVRYLQPVRRALLADRLRRAEGFVCAGGVGRPFAGEGKGGDEAVGEEVGEGEEELGGWAYMVMLMNHSSSDGEEKLRAQ